jgi:TonB family protein
MVVTSARADVFDDNGRWVSPKYDLLKAKWPRDASGRLIFGEVLLDCGVGASSHATDCRVKASEPANPASERAALELASLYKARDAKTSRVPLVVAVRYDEEADWLKKPSFGDMEFTYPRLAAAKGEEGMARLKCVVNKQGLVQDCSVQSEEPPGDGFAEAAIALTPTMLFKPATRSGQPVDASISLQIAFVGGGDLGPRSPFLVSSPSWSKTPDAAQVMAQLDKRVGDKFADGKVVFMCSLNKATGKTERCKVVNASQGMAQFSDVGEVLTDTFEASPDTVRQAQNLPEGAEARVFLPFSFPDMASATWNKRYLSHVQWTFIPGPARGHSLFPDEAVKAGIKQGSAAIDCAVADNGSLRDCSVARESTPGVGFGALAKTIAEASTINPWTEEGLPAGGARVLMPIQMNYDPSLAATAVSPTPAAKP